jgi:116 kDa U5 small nuclear ribonucleoprotein component
MSLASIIVHSAHLLQLVLTCIHINMHTHYTWTPQHNTHQVNALLARCWAGVAGAPPRLDPARGNVCFASALHGWCFSAGSFARRYCDYYSSSGLAAADLEKRLWGDCWLDPYSRTFKKKQPPPGPSGEEVERTFVQYVLEPLYKIYSQVSACDSQP